MKSGMPYRTMKDAKIAYEKVKRHCGIPFEQWLFGNRVPPVCIGCDEDAAAFIWKHCHIPKDHEEFYVICLDGDHRTMCSPVVVGKGVVNGVCTDSRAVFGPAVWWGASAVVIAHNHPSGDTAPSKKDISLTEVLVGGGKILRIPVLSHIVVTEDSFETIPIEK